MQLRVPHNAILVSAGIRRIASIGGNRSDFATLSGIGVGGVLLSRALLIAALAFLAPACAGPVGLGCRDGRAMVNDMLYFGTAKPGGVVSAGEWRRFVDTAVTPRFPDGLTLWAASGQWREEGGSVVRESSYVLSLVHADDAAAEKAVDEIRKAYRAQFHQESVLRVRGKACVTF